MVYLIYSNIRIYEPNRKPIMMDETDVVFERAAQMFYWIAKETALGGAVPCARRSPSTRL
jgi:hypothetical protein